MKLLLPLLPAIFCVAATLPAQSPSAPLPRPAFEAMTADDMLKHIKVLASDEFEGRAPGSKGEELSVKYISDQFKAIGLKPGNPNGTYTQEVPLAGIKSAPIASFTANGQAMPLRFPEDYVASSARLESDINLKDSDVVFVGYGVVAPEYGWDDYKDVDVKGKTILMLINDPAIPDPSNPAALDEKMFKGKAMTYYGRWTYKYEIAAQRGATAAVIIHETEPAAYPYSVVQTSWSKENFELDAPNKNMDQVQVRSWITLDVAKKLITAGGQDFEVLKKQAISKDFRPVPLNAKANFAIKQEVRSFKSHNVVGKIEGMDPKARDEYLLYSAHWDHLGRHPELKGDQIFNGASDNASGVAGLIELARAHVAAKANTKRSILFMATTAEEAGLLGAKWYAQHPLYPLEKTVADINMDGINSWGKTRDIEDISFELTTLGDMLSVAAKREQRVVKPNSLPEKGSFYRADQFEFAKVGLPSIYTNRGQDFIGRPSEWGMQKTNDYIAHDYHQVTDEVKPDWDLSGGIDDLRLLFNIGYELVSTNQWPEWKAGTEFKPARDAMMARNSK